jgi:oligopeptide transport system permease protein
MWQKTMGLVLTLWVVATATFFFMHQMPGGPFDRERSVPPAVKAQLEARYHLSAPIAEQYSLYVQGLLRGDLGPSYQYPSRTVVDMLAESVPVSAMLGVFALVFGTVAGMATGLMAGVATGPAQWMGALVGSFSLSIPTYLWGGLLVLVFALWLNWLPAATLLTPMHWVLPVATLSLLPFSFTFMLVKTRTHSLLADPFIRIKHAYGLPQAHITWRHVLRLAVLPVVSLIGPIAATILTGSFAVETLFAIPGIGKQFVNAVIARDYTVVMGITLVYSVLLVVFNTTTDWLATRLDPRLQEG